MALFSVRPQVFLPHTIQRVQQCHPKWKLWFSGHSQKLCWYGVAQNKNHQIVSGMSVPTICAVIRLYDVCGFPYLVTMHFIYKHFCNVVQKACVMRVRFVFLEKSVFGDGCSIYQQHAYKVHYSLFNCLSSKPSKLSI